MLAPDSTLSYIRSLSVASTLAILLAPIAFAGETAKDLKKTIEEGPYVETAQKGIKLSGYIDSGYTYNFVGNGATIRNRALRSDSNPRGDFNLHAMKVVLEKELTDANELQAGFRVDTMMGEDAANFSGAGGNDSDSIWLQQAYSIVRVPWGNGVDISVGKMGAYLGFEADERPDNINITPGNNAAIDPAKMTGVALAYPFSEQWGAGLMIANGSGQDNDIGVDNTGDSAIVATYISYTNTDNFETQLGFHIAPTGDAGITGATENKPALIMNWWSTWVPKFAKEKLFLAYNASFANIEGRSDDLAIPTTDGSSSNWYSLALYGKYQFTDIISLGSRVEYVHTSDDRILGFGNNFDGAGTNISTGRNDIWGWTTTLGFNLAEDLLVRLEYRLDYGKDLVNTSKQTAGSAFTTVNSAHTAAVQVVYSF